jgi:hypothetical protein
MGGPFSLAIVLRSKGFLWVRVEPVWIALREPISSIRNVAELPLYGAPFNGLDMFDVPDLLKRAKSKVLMIEEIGEFLRQSELW